MKWLTIYQRLNAFAFIGISFLALGFILIMLGLASQSPPTAAGGGASVAVAASMFALWVQGRKEAIDASKFYLDSALEGFQQAHELLGEKPDRIKWVAAARILLHVREIRKKIEEPEHKVVYRMYFEDMRVKVSIALGHRKREPHRYFATGGETLFDAAANSTQTYQRTRHSGLVISESHYIPPGVILCLLQFVEDSEEPDTLFFEDMSFTELQLMRIEHMYPGLYAYVKLHEGYWFRGGKIVRKFDNRVMTPDDDYFPVEINGSGKDANE
jgi:hypothetical protein